MGRANPRINLTRVVDKAHMDGVRHDSMIHLVKVGLALCLSWVPLCVLVAQDRANKSVIAERTGERTEGRLASVAEGIAVLNAAR